jgi:excinuclease UvrABC ATPase subunit
VATGTPEQVANVAESFTGQYLREVLPAFAAAAA